MTECPWPPLRRQLGLPALKLQLGKKESHLRCKESWMRFEGTTVKIIMMFLSSPLREGRIQEWVQQPPRPKLVSIVGRSWPELSWRDSGQSKRKFYQKAIVHGFRSGSITTNKIFIFRNYRRRRSSNINLFTLSLSKAKLKGLWVCG